MSDKRGQRIGYVRVSSIDQNTTRQLDGQELDRVYEDKCSGKDTARPELQACLRFLREGDTLVVHSMDRLSRNLSDLLKLVDGLTQRGVTIEFLKPSRLVFDGRDDKMSRLLLQMLGAVAEFERAMIRERQREGIEKAKRRGIYKGRKPALNDKQIAELKQRIAAGEKKTEIAKALGITRQTVYAYAES